MCTNHPNVLTYIYIYIYIYITSREARIDQDLQAHAKKIKIKIKTLESGRRSLIRTFYNWLPLPKLPPFFSFSSGQSEGNVTQPPAIFETAKKNTLGRGGAAVCGVVSIYFRHTCACGTYGTLDNETINSSLVLLGGDAVMNFH